ncbi:MAG: carboxypeptidase-like regulatory domain-containing protein [Treponema sp.]|nr:carboxypeptidase-like regulatory domain-containing protein [Treponema sp.]
MKKGLVMGVSITMILVLAGCSTMMTVNATDQHGMPVHGANVIVDGEHIGQTPTASTRVSNFIGGSTSITVSADGYLPRTIEAAREAKAGPIIGGFFIWPIWLWTWGPRPQQNVVLTPVPLRPAAE